MDKIEIISTTVNDIVRILNGDEAFDFLVGIMAICCGIELALILILGKDFQHDILKTRDKIAIILTLVIPLSGIFIGCAVADNFIKEEAIIGQEYIYEMYVPDDVPINEFLNKYEVVSRDGNNYVAREVVLYEEPIPVKGGETDERD